jgi:hypothetical protein
MDWIQRADAAWVSPSCGAVIRAAVVGGVYCGYDVFGRGGRLIEWATTLDDAKRKAESAGVVREKVRWRRAAH